MADLGQTYNDDTIERKVMTGGPVPSGTYVARVARTEQKPTRKEGGMFLEIEFDILDPEQYANRKVWDRINFRNPSQKTMEIAKEQLEDLRQACGISELSDDAQLMDAVVKIEVIVDAGEDYIDANNVKQKGKDSNRILKYWHVEVDVEARKRERQAAKSNGSGSAPAQRPAATAAGQAGNWPKANQAPQQQAAQAPAGNAKPWAKHAPR